MLEDYPQDAADALNLVSKYVDARVHTALSNHLATIDNRMIKCRGTVACMTAITALYKAVPKHPAVAADKQPTRQSVCLRCKNGLRQENMELPDCLQDATIPCLDTRKKQNCYSDQMLQISTHETNGLEIWAGTGAWGNNCFCKQKEDVTKANQSKHAPTPKRY